MLCTIFKKVSARFLYIKNVNKKKRPGEFAFARPLHRMLDASTLPVDFLLLGQNYSANNCVVRRFSLA